MSKSIEIRIPTEKLPAPAQRVSFSEWEYVAALDEETLQAVALRYWDERAGARTVEIWRLVSTHRWGHATTDLLLAIPGTDDRAEYEALIRTWLPQGTHPLARMAQARLAWLQRDATGKAA